MIDEQDDVDSPNCSTTEDTFYTTWNPNEDSPSTILPIVLASLTNTSTAGLPPLYDYVDGEALDKLLQGSYGGEAAVEFEYESYYIRITSAGDITIQR
jgi:hypothetical protein